MKYFFSNAKISFARLGVFINATMELPFRPSLHFVPEFLRTLPKNACTLARFHMNRRLASLEKLFLSSESLFRGHFLSAFLAGPRHARGLSTGEFNLC